MMTDAEKQTLYTREKQDKIARDIKQHNPDWRIFKHFKGGIYQFLFTGTDTESGKTKVAYRHLWPCESGYFFREVNEFHETYQPEGWSMWIERFEEVL